MRRLGSLLPLGPGSLFVISISRHAAAFATHIWTIMFKRQTPNTVYGNLSTQLGSQLNMSMKRGSPHHCCSSALMSLMPICFDISLIFCLMTHSYIHYGSSCITKILCVHGTQMERDSSCCGSCSLFALRNQTISVPKFDSCTSFLQSNLEGLDFKLSKGCVNYPTHLQVFCGNKHARPL